MQSGFGRTFWWLGKTLKGITFPALWASTIMPKYGIRSMSPQDLKESLLCQALLNFTLRAKVGRTVIPLHGIILLVLLVGEPGIGKTSLARGLASKTAALLPSKKLAYLEVEPHSLGSSSLGKTQKAVTELFGQTIAEHAQICPTFVLLDEVETLIVDRSKLSMERVHARLGRGKELGTRYRRFEGSKVEEGHLCPRNSNSKYPWNSPLGNSAEGTDRGRGRSDQSRIGRESVSNGL
jgi:hypothetical protein